MTPIPIWAIVFVALLFTGFYFLFKKDKTIPKKKE